MTHINNFSKLFYTILAAVLLVSCSKEEEIVNFTELENLYAITDDPANPIKHKQYEIYKEYNVPVYFNDTISGKQIGTDIYDRPIMQYETLDLNWGFDSYNTSIKYIFDYLETDEEKMNALNVVENYLKICSRSMRPFNVLVVKGLSTSPEGALPKNYFIGYRSLVIYGVESLSEESEISAISHSIINNMVVDKVKADHNVVARFGAVSDPGWYGKYKTEMSTYTEYAKIRKIMGSLYNPNALFYGEPYLFTYDGQLDFVDTAMSYRNMSREEAESWLRRIVLEEGAHGFIRGWNLVGAYTPSNVDEDLDIFVKGIMGMGKTLFIERFGDAPLVMEKYNILYDYITNELKVEI